MEIFLPVGLPIGGQKLELARRIHMGRQVLPKNFARGWCADRIDLSGIRLSVGC